MLRSYEAIYDHGHLQWVDAPPAVDSARVIVTVLQDTSAGETLPTLVRRPSPLIAGRGKILGDIVSPVVPVEDWDALK